MKILIIEASYPKDFFNEQLDGRVTHHLTKLLGIESRLVYALDRQHLKKAIGIATEDRYDVVHLSCHGGDDGIAVTDDTNINWRDFVGMFAVNGYSPKALVMSVCCGAADGLADEFEKVEARPKIIFGSTDKRYYNEYAVAWTMLYNLFHTGGLRRSVARTALRSISAVVHRNFRYLRWHDEREEYVQFPGEDRQYVIVEQTEEECTE